MDYYTIYKNIEYGEYNSSVPYPEIYKPTKPKLDKESAYYDDVIAEYESSLKAYTEAFIAYRNSKSMAMEKFGIDIISMFKSFGANEKQAHNAYQVAYDLGHSTGLIEILNYANQLCSIFDEK